MKKIVGIMMVLGLACAANASVIVGDVIKIDFGSTATTEANWNTSVISSTTDLVRLSDGANTAVGLTIAEVAGGFPVNNDEVFVNGSAQGGSSVFEIYDDGLLAAGTGNDAFTLTFTGLDDSLTYNLFAGGLSLESDVGATWTISTTADGSTVQTTTYQNTDGYVSFTGITSVGGTFTLNLNDISDAKSPAAGRNIGLSELTLTVIPEPATIGMLGLGALITMVIRRMQRS
jgi:hypothetical protein